jgi:phenylalanyl-tRNA synthetase beta chain
LSARLTRAGLEVEGVENPARALRGVLVARVVEAKQHPSAEKLSVTQVEAGGPPLQVVCGAKNFQVGDLVPLAMVGTTLPNGTAIQQAALRGVESHGMLCSAREPGPPRTPAAWSPPLGLKPGTPIAEALGPDDAVLEVNVTPTGARCLSHLGSDAEPAISACRCAEACTQRVGDPRRRS